MCNENSFGTPTGGIPLVPEIHNQFPDEVKKAFETFHAWLMKQNDPPSRSKMPQEISKAYETIKKAKIPGYGETTCEASCYIMSVEKNLID